MRGTPVRSVSGENAAAALPEGPVATPARGRTIASRVQVAVQPLGRISYDGQTMPIVSPDGRFLAVQTGEAATWDVLLGAPASGTPRGAAVAVYRIDGKVTELVDLAESTSGLLLSRSADESEFLAEWPKADGTRSIVAIDWVSGRRRIVLDGPHMFRTPSFTAAGDVVCVRAGVTGESGIDGGGDLVLVTRSGAAAIKSAEVGAYTAAMAVGGDIVLAIQSSRSGLELHAVRIARGGSGATPALGAVVARRRIASVQDPLIAFQVFAPVQGAGPTRGGDAAGLSPSPVVFSPLTNSMAVFDLESAQLRPLATGSVGAAWWSREGQSGWFITTPDGLEFQAGPGEPAAGVVSRVFMPRAMPRGDGSLILLGPTKGTPDRLDVVRMRVSE